MFSGYLGPVWSITPFPEMRPWSQYLKNTGRLDTPVSVCKVKILGDDYQYHKNGFVEPLFGAGACVAVDIKGLTEELAPGWPQPPLAGTPNPCIC